MEKREYSIPCPKFEVGQKVIDRGKKKAVIQSRNLEEVGFGFEVYYYIMHLDTRQVFRAYENEISIAQK